MIGDLKTLNHRLLTRRCVGCGYDGALLRGGAANRCARCGCDLRKRPARSYAEMEGLIGRPLTVHSPLHQADMPPERMIHRWLAFLFFLLVGIVALAYLCTAAVAVV